MGWEDRSYYRERGPSGGFNPLMWLFTGTVPLFVVFGIRVKAHASMFLIMALILLFGMSEGSRITDKVQGATFLFLVVLLHEFGHCFAARWVGGEADEIIMHPLGGLAMARPPRRPLPTFITVAGGPAVNVLICIITGVLLYIAWDYVPWNPLQYIRPKSSTWLEVGVYAYWFYTISFFLLLFNLLPIFPLDGGQMLQSILWPWVGYYKSMKFACITGMIGAVVVGIYGMYIGQFLLLGIAIMGFFYCFQMNQQLKQMGPGMMEDEPEFAVATYTSENRSRRKANDRAAKRLAKLKQDEVDEQERIDAILAKVSAQGMQSLTWMEKRALRKATEHQRQRDAEKRNLRR